MPKYLFEDMVRSKRERKEIKKVLPLDQPPIKAIYETEVVKEAQVVYSKSRGRYMLWIIAGISIIFCLFAISFLFSDAKILVNPKITEVVLDEKLSANLNANDGLPFNLVVFDDIESKIIKATGEKDVAQSATGKVIIYNSFSSAPQTLNIDTRLEGSNGKIYKTKIKTIVPGMKKGSTTPGSVEVEIYAAEPGEEYNSGPLDFSILGFKGTPKYSKFYARSKGGTEITGGFKGKIPAVSDEDKMAVVKELEIILKAKLLKKVLTPDFVLFKEAVFFNIEEADIVSTTTDDDSATITLKGTIYGILFNEEKLTKKIAEDNIKDYDGVDTYIPDITDLIFTLSNKADIPFEDLEKIDFSLFGEAKIVSKLDEDKFISDLLGISKKNFVQVLSQYPHIESAILKLRFPWMQSIPDKMENVKVIVNYPE